MATMNVLDAAGSTVAVEKPLTPGRAAAASSRPVALSTEDKAALDAVATAANQTSQITQETAINTVLGVKTDAKSTATDATSVSAMSVWKQISASIQAAATSLATLVSNAGSPGPQTASASTSVTPANSSDVTKSRVNSAASTNATLLKSSAGVLRSIDVFNTAAYTVFLKFYDKASAPTVGTDAPFWTIPIPAGTGFSKQYFIGTPCSLGITYAITKLQADSDATNVAAGDLTGTINWV